MTRGTYPVPVVRTPWQQAVRRFRRRRTAAVGLAVLVVLAASALLAGAIAPRRYDAQDLSRTLQAPGPGGCMGTDLLGRDLFSRLLYGQQVSFRVALLATAVSVGIGVTVGAVAGFLGGWVDTVLMRGVDVVYGLPVIAYLILVLSVVRAGGLAGTGWDEAAVYVAIGMVSWLTMARIVRGQVMALRDREFVEAARALGAPGSTILVRHILPNALGPVIVYVTLTIPGVMLMEALLSFLGLGIQPPRPSLGTLISDGAQALNVVRIYWWLIAFPAGVLGVTLLCLNAVGDGLRDALDVR